MVWTSDDDRMFAWRHAYDYAIHHHPDRSLAKAYAEHYQDVIKDEDDIRYWPGHSTIYPAWWEINRKDR